MFTDNTLHETLTENYNHIAHQVFGYYSLTEILLAYHLINVPKI